MTCVTASPRTGCARGIASTSVRSYLRPTESEDWVGTEEAATEPSDALPADDKEVVLVGARTLHSGAEPMPDTSDTKVDPDEDTKNEDSGAFRLSAGPQTRGVAPAVPSPGVFIGARNSPMGCCSNKLIGN